MRFTVQIELEVDLDGWRDEYNLSSTAAALTDVLARLREPEQHLAAPMWAPLATVGAVVAQVDGVFPIK
jgi:hypothetical protein